MSGILQARTDLLEVQNEGLHHKATAGSKPTTMIVIGRGSNRRGREGPTQDVFGADLCRPSDEPQSFKQEPYAQQQGGMSRDETRLSTYLTTKAYCRCLVATIPRRWQVLCSTLEKGVAYTVWADTGGARREEAVTWQRGDRADWCRPFEQHQSLKQEPHFQQKGACIRACVRAWRGGGWGGQIKSRVGTS